jgi:adenylate kinase family enzyme
MTAPPRRVHVSGASGAGVTTFGRALAHRLEVPHLDTDDFYWQPSDPPFRRERELPERLDLLRHALSRSRGAWVLSGSLDGWGDPLVPLVDLVVFLLVPTEVRLARLRARERQRYGDEALAPEGRLHEQAATFLAWAAAYEEGTREERSRPRHERWLARLSCPVIRIEGVLSTGAMLRRVLGGEAPENSTEN